MFDLKIKRPSPNFYHILIFIVSQLTWFLLVGLWIYWYVSNYIMLDKMDGKLEFDPILGNLNIIALIGGLFLLLLLSAGMSWIFIYLNRQLNITRLYDNFISNVTHELKSPLSSIQMYVETMQKREISESRKKEFLNMMQQDTERLGNLINSILYLSSLENQKLAKTVPHNYDVFDTDSLLNDIINELQKELKLNKNVVTMEGKTQSECVVDRNWLKIVLSNLLDNAIKYCMGKPEILIKLSKGLKYFYINIADKGIGIRQADFKKVFKKFERLYNADIPNVKGTGLGLYWVKGIIKSHGGKISVESAGINKGTTFKIALPIYKTTQRRFINSLLKHSRKQSENRFKNEE